jgi:hypothetical protein
MSKISTADRSANISSTSTPTSNQHSAMPNHNVSSSTGEAASESKRDTQQSPGEAAQHATTATYQAPYYCHGGDAVPGSYFVVFYPGHTVAKHFAFLDRKFDLTTLNEGYFADLDDELFNAIRRDPGVEYTEDDFSGERDG